MTSQTNNKITEVNLSVLANIDRNIKNIDQEANANRKQAVQKTLTFFNYSDMILLVEDLISAIKVLSLDSNAREADNLRCIGSIAEIIQNISLSNEASFLDDLLMKEQFNKDKFISIKEFEKLLKTKLNNG